jgi:hypothetical protein
MRNSPGTTGNLDYPEDFFQHHEMREKWATAQDALIAALLIWLAPVAISFVSVFWLVRLLSRKASKRGRRFLLLLYGVPALCAPVSGLLAFISVIPEVYGGPDPKEVEQRARAAHERARAAILSAEEGSGRFALFVRNFDHERDIPTLLPWGTYVNRWTLEQRLAKILASYMPTVTLASPGSDAATEFHKSEVLRLLVDTDQWQHTFRRLAARATLIIILDEPGGPGLRYELSVIDELSRSADSIVLTDEDFNVLTFGFGDGKDFELADYEEKVAIIRRHQEEESDGEFEIDEPVADSIASSLIAKISGNAESGLLRLRELLRSGRL